MIEIQLGREQGFRRDSQCSYQFIPDWLSQMDQSIEDLSRLVTVSMQRQDSCAALGNVLRL